MMDDVKPRPNPEPEIRSLLEKCCDMDAKKSCPHAIVRHGKLPVALEGVENSGQGIHQLHQRLIDEGCAAVVMESSGLYWMGICDYLDLGGINAVLVNPRSLKAITGKKTDMSGSV